MLKSIIVEDIGETPSRSDMAYNAIREAIARGRIKPGEWLRQEVLAKQLGVSQVTVREALSRLVSEGLASNIPYRGVKSVLLPFNELEDVYELRAILEGRALEIAAGKITPEDLARMKALLPRTIIGASPESAQEAWKANREFHMIGIRASGRRHMSRILSQLLDLTNPYAPLSEATEGERLQAGKKEKEDHAHIFEALEARDGERVRKLIVQHLEKALESLKSLLSKNEKGA